LIRFGLDSNKYSRCNIQLSSKPLTVAVEFKLKTELRYERRRG